MTKFTEFYNKQKNIIKSSISKRLEAGIPISEERDAFYKGDLFKKYDIVESEGKQYTILEQASNYYQVVDSEGNLSRKFPKQLTKIGHSNTSIVNNKFHGYEIVSEEAKTYFGQHFFDEAIDCDDVGILKQVKQLDEQMDSSYKSKDKLTVAKIIADAVGVPHDMVSTPENLVAAAIRKAKKDPKLVKNKEILANMLQIAKEVGIKITDETFEVKESEELDEETTNHVYLNPLGRSSNPKKVATIQGRVTKKHLDDLAAKHKTKPEHFEWGNDKWNKQYVKESEELTEAQEQEHFKNAMEKIHPTKRNAARKAYEKARSNGHTHASALSNMHSMFSESVDEETIHVGYRNSRGVWIKTSTHDNYRDAMKASEELEKSGKKGVQHVYDYHGSIDPGMRKLAHESVDESNVVRQQGGRTMVSAAAVFDKAKELAAKDHDPKSKKRPIVTKVHMDAAKKHVLSQNESIEDLDEAAVKLLGGHFLVIHNGKVIGRHATKEDAHEHAKELKTKKIDESGLSRKTIDSYLEKSKESKPGTIHKAIKRFAGQERAQDRVHKDEMEQMKKRLSLKEMRAKLSEELTTDQKVDQANDVPDADVEAKPHELPHGHTLNPTSETHRKQLIRKVRGDD